jgi:thiamine-monophosphate kinase
MDEFDFINHIKKKHSLPLVGDDCAVVPKDSETELLVTADMLVEEMDFRLEWTTPRILGHKALAVSLSDIAAMGGKPSWALISIGVPRELWNTEFLEEFYEGWHELARIHDVELAGGDVSRTPSSLVIDSTVGGVVASGKAIKRSGASAGDAIYVSGSLGGAAAGLQLLGKGHRYSHDGTSALSSMMLRQLRPQPRLHLADQLQAGALASAMIDISDGISSDLTHLCTASGTGAQIFAEMLPLETGLLDYAGSFDAALEFAIHGGEDFELLFTADPEKISAADLESVTRIGEVTGNPGIIELVRDGGAKTLPAHGHRHF